MRSHNSERRYRDCSPRLQNWDYGGKGWYFITINCKDSFHYFGEVEHQPVQSMEFLLMLTEIGKVAEAFWYEIPKHYPFVKVDESVVMPNHLHGILMVDPSASGSRSDAPLRCSDAPLRCSDAPLRVPPPTQSKAQFGPRSNTLGAVIGAFKSSVKRYANEHNLPFAWRPRYYDQIIWSVEDLERIRQYIKLNPQRWWEKRGGR